jgi:hypothetical protein
MIPSAGAGALGALFEVPNMGHDAAQVGYKQRRRSRLRSRNNRIEPVEMVFHIHLTRYVGTASLESGLVGSMSAATQDFEIPRNWKAPPFYGWYGMASMST